MQSAMTAEPAEMRGSNLPTPHNRSHRIIGVMRCSTKRRDRCRLVQALRRGPRLPRAQARRSELQRSDLRQPLRRRGRRYLLADLVPPQRAPRRLSRRSGSRPSGRGLSSTRSEARAGFGFGRRGTGLRRPPSKTTDLLHRRQSMAAAAADAGKARLCHECCLAQYSVCRPLTEAIRAETLDLRLFL